MKILMAVSTWRGTEPYPCKANPVMAAQIIQNVLDLTPDSVVDATDTDAINDYWVEAKLEGSRFNSAGVLDEIVENYGQVTAFIGNVTVPVVRR